MSAVNNYYAPFELQISGKDCIERYLSDLGEKDISVTNRSDNGKIKRNHEVFHVCKAQYDG